MKEIFWLSILLSCCRIRILLCPRVLIKKNYYLQIIDILGDLRGVNLLAMRSLNTGMIILGGGLIKHHICNANLMRNGADFRQGELCVRYDYSKIYGFGSRRKLKKLHPPVCSFFFSGVFYILLFVPSFSLVFLIVSWVGFVFTSSEFFDRCI